MNVPNKPQLTVSGIEGDIDHLFKLPLTYKKEKVRQINATNPSPFRPDGRGARQLIKAKEQTEESCIVESEMKWVLCASSPACFAILISDDDEKSAMIQPLHSNPNDPALLQPWDGHIWLAKKNTLVPVKMRKELGGYRVIMTSAIKHWIEKLNKRGGNFSYPMSFEAAIASGKDDWDMVSLESSEFDESASMESSSSTLFPLLQCNSSYLKSTTENKPSILIPLPMKHKSSFINCRSQSINTTAVVGGINNGKVIPNFLPKFSISSLSPPLKSQIDNQKIISFSVENEYINQLRSPVEVKQLHLIQSSTPDSDFKCSSNSVILSAATTRSSSDQSTLSNFNVDESQPQQQYEDRLLESIHGSRPRSNSLDDKQFSDVNSEASYNSNTLSLSKEPIHLDHSSFLPKPSSNIIKQLYSDVCESDSGKVSSISFGFVNYFKSQDSENLLVTAIPNTPSTVVTETEMASVLGDSDELNKIDSERLQDCDVKVSDDTDAQGGIAMKGHIHSEIRRKKRKSSDALMDEAKAILPPRASRNRTVAVHRDAFLGSCFPSRKQSAATGNWKI